MYTFLHNYSTFSSIAASVSRLLSPPSVPSSLLPARSFFVVLISGMIFRSSVSFVPTLNVGSDYVADKERELRSLLRLLRVASAQRLNVCLLLRIPSGASLILYIFDTFPLQKLAHIIFFV